MRSNALVTELVNAMKGFAGQVKCPIDKEDVTIYLSRIKMSTKNPDVLKLNYDCTMKTCKKEGYCVFRDPYPLNLM
jgi:hypothetical protein